MVERDSRKPPPRPCNRVYPRQIPLSSARYPPPPLRPSPPPLPPRPPRPPPLVAPRSAQSIRTQIDCRIIIENTRAAGSRVALFIFFFPSLPLPFCPLPRGHTINSLSFCRYAARNICRVIWSFSRAIASLGNVLSARVLCPAHVRPSARDCGRVCDGTVTCSAEPCGLHRWPQ